MKYCFFSLNSYKMLTMHISKACDTRFSKFYSTIGYKNNLPYSKSSPLLLKFC